MIAMSFKRRLERDQDKGIEPTPRIRELFRVRIVAAEKGGKLHLGIEAPGVPLDELQKTLEHALEIVNREKQKVAGTVIVPTGGGFPVAAREDLAKAIAG